MTPEQMLLNTVVTPTGCMEWAGDRHADGYGLRGTLRIHREVFKHFKGPIPRGRMVCHSCDNPPCVNPGHLWLGDNQQNQRDASLKRRQRGQRDTHCSKGHEYTPGNTYWRPGKVASRDCRQCIRDRVKLYKSKRAA